MNSRNATTCMTLIKRKEKERKKKKIVVINYFCARVYHRLIYLLINIAVSVPYLFLLKTIRMFISFLHTRTYLCFGFAISYPNHSIADLFLEIIDPILASYVQIKQLDGVPI